MFDLFFEGKGLKVLWRCGIRKMVEIIKINDVTWKVEKQGKMLVPILIFASEPLLEKMQEDSTLQQAQNMASVPGVVKNVIVCPDAHQGYGACIGGVSAYDFENGVVSPGQVGYDINCGVRLVVTNLKKDDIEKKKQEIVDDLFRAIPSGVGKGSVYKITKDDLKEILKEGAEWAVKKGFGTKEDLEKTEDGGRISFADPSAVSERALQRGFSQLGSLGSGNHFLEIQYVSRIFQRDTAKTFGLLEEGQAVVLLHCGSRGLGHQVASDYIKKMEDDYGWEHLPDRELVNAPISSELGKKYLGAMGAAANFAFCNRQMILEWVRQSFVKIFGSHVKLEMVYDVTHNMAKIEEDVIDGKKIKLCVHRKGATRALGPGRKELPEVYRDDGQPIFIPGSMGTSSYVLVGTKKAEELTFSSTAHGAGRMMSRHAAIRTWRGEDVKRDLAKKNVYIKAGSWSGISEEAPGAYKDVDEVVKVSDEAGIGKIVAQLRPMGVVKG